MTLQYPVVAAPVSDVRYGVQRPDPTTQVGRGCVISACYTTHRAANELRTTDRPEQCSRLCERS